MWNLTFFRYIRRHHQQHLIFTYIDSRLQMTTKTKQIGHERFECAVSTYTQQIQRTIYLN